jgi:hypothetical protein
MIPRSSLVALALLGACVAKPPPTAETAGSITGVVRYAGPEHGALRIGVFAAFPPTGAPLAELSIDDPSFPAPYAIRGLPTGRYFVLAIVDTDPRDGDRYRPRVDPGGTFGRYDSPASVSVVATDAITGVDIELVAPSQRSPWDRERSAGAASP